MKSGSKKGRPITKSTSSKVPKKNENFVVLYDLCLAYVSQVTKNNQKGSRKDNGFSIYDSEELQNEYCFDNLRQEINKHEGYQNLFEKQSFFAFLEIMAGIGPKPVLFEFLKIASDVILKNTFIESFEAEQEEEIDLAHEILDLQYPFLRFTGKALNHLNEQFQNDQDQIRKKVLKLWNPFFKILEYTLSNEWKENLENKYEKFFFQDDILSLASIVEKGKNKYKSVGVVTEDVSFQVMKPIEEKTGEGKRTRQILDKSPRKMSRVQAFNVRIN